MELGGLRHAIWKHLDLIRVFTKKRGVPPDFSDPLVLRRGSTIFQVCEHVHRSLTTNFRYALLWGSSVKHSPQRCGFAHVVEDEDVVQIIKKTNN